MTFIIDHAVNPYIQNPLKMSIKAIIQQSRPGEIYFDVGIFR